MQKLQTFANVFQLLILKKNTDAIQKKNKASYLKLDNLKIKRVTDRIHVEIHIPKSLQKILHQLPK